MFYDTRDYRIYCAILYGITSDAIINPNLSKTKNLQRAIIDNNIEQLEYLYLKKTIYRNLYQEIITGKMIPAYRKINLGNFAETKRGPLESAFIIVPEKTLGYRNIMLNHISRYEKYKLDNYYKQHSDVNAFAQDLENIFAQAEQKYIRLLNKK